MKLHLLIAGLLLLVSLKIVTACSCLKSSVADGKPVPDGFVGFEAVDVPEGYQGKTHTSVDAQGRFELPVLAGFKGLLRGYVFTYKGEYLDCPKADQISKDSGIRVPEISTERIPMEINSDKLNLELRLPIPFCAKAKEP